MQTQCQLLEPMLLWTGRGSKREHNNTLLKLQAEAAAAGGEAHKGLAR